MLSGKKTYILCALAFVWAIVGLICGWLEVNEAVALLEVSLVGAGLRAGVSKIKPPAA